MKVDDFLDDTPSAEAFLGESARAPVTDNWSERMPAGRGNAKRVRKPQSVLETPAAAASFAAAPDPVANAQALFKALTGNPELVNSPMFSAGAAALQREVTGQPSSVQAASRRNQVDNVMAAQKAARIAAARDSTSSAFGESPTAQAIVAPGQRLLSGVASVMGGVAGIPQMFGSDLGKETADALSLMSKANMPADPGLADDVLAGVGQVGPMALGGSMIRGGLSRLVGETLATEAATGIMGGVGGALSGSQVMDDLEFRSDLTDAQKQGRALFAAIVSGASGKAADRFLLPGADRAVSGPLQAGGRALLAEGAQEGLDQVTQNFATDKDLSDGVARAALVGGLVGGGTRVAGELGSPANALAGAIDADAQTFADAPRPQIVQQPTARIVGDPLPAPVPAPLAQPAPAPIPALAYDPNVQQPAGVMVVDNQGQARPMTADEFLEADDTRQQAIDSGLTPDVRRAQENRTDPASEPAPVETPELVQQLMARGWTPPVDTSEDVQEPMRRAAATADDGRASTSAPVVDAEQRALNDAMAADLESMYQADIKDSIRERLGLQRPADDAPAPRNTAFYGFLKEHGLKADLASDIYGDNAFRANRALPGVFRKGGMQLDELVQRAVERGFMTPSDVENALDTGGTRKLVELIQHQIRGTAPVSTEMADDVAQRRAQSRVTDELEQQAQAIGFDTRGMDDGQVAGALRRIERRRQAAGAKQAAYDAKREAAAERAAIQDTGDMTVDDVADMETSWDNSSNTSTEAAMRALGFTDQEIQNATANRPESPREDRAGDGASGRNEARGSQGPLAADEGSGRRPEDPGEGLTSYTPGEVLGRQAQAEQADKAAAKQNTTDELAARREREQREIDARQQSSADNFELGQDPDDSISGQGGLFSRPADATQTGADVRAEIAERFGPVIDRLEQRGLLKVWDTVQAFNDGQSSENIEGVASGYYDGKTAHLFADGIEPGTAVAVLLHEVGEHATMAQMLGPRYDDLVRRAHALVGQENAIAMAADARIPEDTAPEHRDSELLAYMIEEATTRAAKPGSLGPAMQQWLADTIAALRAWWSQTKLHQVMERYGQGLDLSPADIAALAVRAVKWQAANGSSTETAGQFARPSGNAAQAAANVFGKPRTAAPAPPTPPQPNSVASAAQPWTVPEPGTWDSIVRTMQNNKIDLKRVRAAIEERAGRLPEASDAYLQEELYHGKVAARVEKLHQEAVLPMLRKIAVAGQNVGVTMDDVNQYLHARHAPERNATMEAINPTMPNNKALSGMSDADAAKIMADLQANGKAPALASIAADVDRLLSDTRTGIVADGLEDAGVVQAWEKAYKHYVPLQRDIEGTGTPKGQGFNVKGPESKRAMGSNRDVVNILANVVTQAETAVIRGEKAEVGRALLAMARQNPNPDFWTVDVPPTKPRIDPNTGLVQRHAVDPNFQTAENVLMVKDYGAINFIVFNKANARAMETAKAMKNLDIQQLPKLIQWVGKGTRFMASLLTQRNPEFWLTNFARDLQGSAIQMSGTDAEGLQGKVLANLPDAFAGVRDVARDTGRQTQWSRYAREFLEAGGATGYMQMFDNSDQRMKDLQKEVDRMQQGVADPRRLVRQMLDFVDDYNDVIENGMRLAVFQAVRDSGVSTPRAASIAKNITVNFNRKGNSSAFVNSLYMFFNAGIQGSARLAEALATSNKARIAVGSMAAVAFVMDMVNRSLAGDDEETGRNRYDLIPEFEKSRNWIFMVPGKKMGYVKVPLPLGFHVFHNAGRLMSDAVGRKDPRNASEYGWAFAGTMLDAFSPIGGFASVGQGIAPSVLDPVVQVAENKNFMGGPVYKSDDQGFGKTDPKPAYTRYFDSTPDFWKAASRSLNDITGGDKEKRGLVNVEPDILRHIYGAMTGGPGRFADRAIDSAQGKARGQEITAARLPLVSRFYGETDDKQRDRAYYEDAKRVAKAKDEFDYFTKEGRRDLAMEVLKEVGKGDQSRGRKVIVEFERSKKDARSINKRLRELQQDNTDDSAQVEQLAALRKSRYRIHARALKNTEPAETLDE